VKAHLGVLPGKVPSRVAAANITKEHFKKHILGKEPVIVTGAIDQWMEVLQLDLIADQIGQMMYPVHTNQGENWILSNPERNPTPLSSFDTFLENSFKGGECADEHPPHNCSFLGVRISLGNISMLSHHLELPEFMTGLYWMRDRSGVWAAQKHLRVPPHVDGYSHRFMAHLSGMKRVVLLPPGYLENKNTDVHPILAKGFLLRPGEILYIPPCWTHQVYYVNFAVTAIIRMTVGYDRWLQDMDYIACGGPLQLKADTPNSTSS